MKQLGLVPQSASWDASKGRKRPGDSLGVSNRRRKMKSIIKAREKRSYRALLKTFSCWTDDDKDEDQVNNENDISFQSSLGETSGLSIVNTSSKSNLNETINLTNDSNFFRPVQPSPSPNSNTAVFKKIFGRDLVSTPKIVEPVEEPKKEITTNQEEINLPTLPRSYEEFKQETEDKKQLFSREWINDMRKAILEGHNEADRIRREKEDYLRAIGKKRENYLRKVRRETGKSLAHEGEFSYLPYFYRFFADERELKAEEESEEEIEEEEEEEEAEDQVPILSQEIKKFIEELFAKRREELIVEENGVEVRVKDLETLKGTNWLNDEIINFYFQLIQKRSNVNKDNGGLKVYCFNTFFYKRLTEGGHKALKRWTKKVDLFSYDLILIPVHLEVHWTLAAISMKDLTIKYYDSMNGNNRECLTLLLKYLEDELKDKKGQVLDASKWSNTIVKGIPQQENGSDCGVFTCKYAERLALGKSFDFSQRHIPYIREKMIYEITQKELLLEKPSENRVLKSL